MAADASSQDCYHGVSSICFLWYHPSAKISHELWHVQALCVLAECCQLKVLCANLLFANGPGCQIDKAGFEQHRQHSSSLIPFFAILSEKRTACAALTPAYDSLAYRSTAAQEAAANARLAEAHILFCQVSIDCRAGGRTSPWQIPDLGPRTSMQSHYPPSDKLMALLL